MARSIHSSCPPSCWDDWHADACDRDLGDGELLIHPQGRLQCHDLWLMAPLMLQIDSSMAPLRWDLLWLAMTYWLTFTDLFEHFLTMSLMIHGQQAWTSPRQHSRWLGHSEPPPLRSGSPHRGCGEGRGPRHGLQMTIKQSVTEDGHSNPTDASEYEYEAYVVNQHK
jgi:hypothetical protein